MRIALAGHEGSEIPAGDQLLADALAEHGHTVCSLAWTAPQAEWDAAEAVVIRSCWDYHLRPGEFLEWLWRQQTRGARIVNRMSLVEWNMDKRYLRTMESSGLAIPHTLWLNGEADELQIDAAMREFGWPAAVVKPLISASAWRTELRTEGIARGPAMVQEFLGEVQSAGEWSVVFLGGEYSHAVLKAPAVGDFRVQKEFGGVAMPCEPRAELIDFCRRVHSALPGTAAFARIDVVAAVRGTVLMEAEVIEPELFLGLDSARRAAAVITEEL